MTVDKMDHDGLMEKYVAGRKKKGCNPWIWVVLRILFYVQNPWSSRLLHKNTEIKIYRTAALPVVYFSVKLGLSHWESNMR
jgi:hypothetical protein